MTLIEIEPDACVIKITRSEVAAIMASLTLTALSGIEKGLSDKCMALGQEMSAAVHGRADIFDIVLKAREKDQLRN